MSNPATVRNYSDEQRHVIAQMAASSYLSSSSPRELWGEDQSVPLYVIAELCRSMPTGNGGFSSELHPSTELHPSIEQQHIAERIGLLQAGANKTSWRTVSIADTASRIQEPASSVQQRIEEIKALGIPYAGKLANRLQYLYKVQKEELPEEQPLSSDSMFSFYEFLKQNSDLAYPQVTLTYEGNIHAVWRKSESQLLAIDFTGRFDVQCVVFAPNRKYPGKVDRASVLTTRGESFDQLAPYCVDSWLRQKG